jgi:hypothetical protein
MATLQTRCISRIREDEGNEEAEWERLKFGSSAREIRKFLKKHPKSRFKGEALARLEQIQSNSPGLMRRRAWLLSASLVAIALLAIAYFIFPYKSADRKAFEAAGNDLISLKAYVESCKGKPCQFVDEAQKRISRILADREFEVAGNNLTKLRAYVDGCKGKQCQPSATQ